jgi:phospholipid transport system substrate-binding protein
VPGPLRRRALAGLILAWAAPALAARPAAAQGAIAADAERFVRDLGERTLAVLGDPSLAREAKLEQLVALVDEATDLDLIARLALGRTWRALDPTRQREYTALFRAMVRRTLAERLGSYSGETLAVAGARALDERDALVSTRIGRAGAAPFRVDWRVRASEGGRLAIVDVMAEGVSLLVTQRAEFGEIVERQGVDGLIEQLRARAGG